MRHRASRSTRRCSPRPRCKHVRALDRMAKARGPVPRADGPGLGAARQAGHLGAHRRVVGRAARQQPGCREEPRRSAPRSWPRSTSTPSTPASTCGRPRATSELHLTDCGRPAATVRSVTHRPEEIPHERHRLPPEPRGWVRRQVEKIEATGDTRSVHMHEPAGRHADDARREDRRHPQGAADAGRARRRLRRGGQQGRGARAPAVVRQPAGRPAASPCRTAPSRGRPSPARSPAPSARSGGRGASRPTRPTPTTRPRPTGSSRCCCSSGSSRTTRRALSPRQPAAAALGPVALGSAAAPRARPCGTTSRPSTGSTSGTNP